MLSSIALTGMMGSGKSTVGRLLSNFLSIPLLDLDESIEKREGRSIAQIFETEGEEGFRAIESASLKRICRDFKGVLATGGGVILARENRGILERWGSVIYLRTSRKVLAARLHGERDARPLLGTRGALEERLDDLLAVRRDLYERAPFIIDTDLLAAEGVCREIITRLSA